jgi:hypothetical protein
MSAVQQMLLGSGGAAGDPYYANVSLLLHMDGSNGSTTFTDNSPSPKTPTVFGTAAVNTSFFKFGTGSIYTGAGSGSNYLSYADTASLKMGTDDFTVEGWFLPTASGNERAFYIHSINATGGLSFFVGLGGVRFRANGTDDLALSTSISGTNFTHIAFVRQGTTRSIFIDGILVSFNTLSFNNNDVSTLQIGAVGASGSDSFRYYGYIDDLRITKGVARYTANFTPPAAAFPNS